MPVLDSRPAIFFLIPSMIFGVGGSGSRDLLCVAKAIFSRSPSTEHDLGEEEHERIAGLIARPGTLHEATLEICVHGLPSAQCLWAQQSPVKVLHILEVGQYGEVVIHEPQIALGKRGH